MRRLTILVAPMLLAACVLHTGHQPSDFEPARTAQGVHASLTVGPTRVDGELLEVRDTGLVVHTPTQLAFIPFSAVTQGTFGSSDVILANARKPDYPDLYKLRMVSRFPYGIPDAALQQLLVSQHQDSLAVMVP